MIKTKTCAAAILLSAALSACAAPAGRADDLATRLFLAQLPDYAAMTPAQLAADSDPYGPCVYSHYHPAPSVAVALKQKGMLVPDDVPDMQQGIVGPGMTTCEMLVTLGLWDHMNVNDYGGACDETQWSFQKSSDPDDPDEEYVYTSCGKVTTVQNQ